MIYVVITKRNDACEHCKVRERLYHFGFQDEDGLFFDEVCMNCFTIQFTDDLKLEPAEAHTILYAMNEFQRSPLYGRLDSFTVELDEGDE